MTIKVSEVLYRTVLRHLKYCEGILAELDSPLARQAYSDVHDARLNIETLQRIEGRQHSVHVLGNRAA